MQKRPKKRWLITARKQRYFRYDMEAIPSTSDPVILQPGDWTTTTSDYLIRATPITEKEANILVAKDRQVRLQNGAHNNILQYADGAKPLYYSYTSGCKCNKCTPKDWMWRPATNFFRGRWESFIRNPNPLPQ